MVLQMLDEFALALAAPDRPTPAFTRGRQGRPDDRRFQVYRNNVAAGLIGALEARFPVTRRLVGDAFFRAMAGAYIAGHKPRSPVMIAYGDDFADFVADFEPARELPYLADVARLESAWVEAYHAAEAEPLTIGDLAGVAAEDFGRLIFTFHPSARLVASAHPAASIWAAHQDGAEPHTPEWRPEQALVVRPHAEVLVRLLPSEGFAFAGALLRGKPLAEAAEPLVEADADPGAALIGLVEAGAFAAFALNS